MGVKICPMVTHFVFAPNTSRLVPRCFASVLPSPELFLKNLASFSSTEAYFFFPPGLSQYHIWCILIVSVRISFFSKMGHLLGQSGPKGGPFSGNPRMWDMSYVNNVGRFLTFLYLLVAPTGCVRTKSKKCREEDQTLLFKCMHDFC